jgi:GPI-anchor transamidase subunit K
VGKEEVFTFGIVQNGYVMELTLFDRYHEMLFMIDTCQANTMYTKFYSPNIIATGSSEIDESSYSHHADNDVGVAVIDRYTYYNLDFLETEITEPSNKKTLGDLFDSYDAAKIHSNAGVRYDLFPGGEQEARKRLVMNFFGNVQNVEVEGAGAGNQTAWKEELEHLKIMIEEANDARNSSPTDVPGVDVHVHTIKSSSKSRRAAKVDTERAWSKQAIGVTALLGCVGVWLGASWFESMK